MDALFVESNPIPLKAGLKIVGLAEDHVRLPLTGAEADTAKKMKDALEHARMALAGDF
jgi:4-hydroxy-tetrahydrodipicolinate synthase